MTCCWLLLNVSSPHPHFLSLLSASFKSYQRRGETPFSTLLSAYMLTVRGDLLPGVGRVHEGGVVDLVVDVFIFVKGEGSAEADVHDDAHRPHVQGAVIALVQQHLGGQVSRRAHHRTTERLLTDDTGKTEVTQLHLGREGGAMVSFYCQYRCEH